MTQPNTRLIDQFIEVIKSSLAKNIEPTEAEAIRWLEAGFDDPEEVSDWLAARCFSAEDARRLDEAGITADQAAIRTTTGQGDYEDTIAYKFTRGDLSLDEARRIMTNEFWNT